MNKIWAIAQREFSAYVRLPSFWILTLGLPVFAALIGGVGLLAGYLAISARSESEAKKPPVGLVDPAGLIEAGSLGDGASAARALEELNVPDSLRQGMAKAVSVLDDVYLPVEDEAQGRKALAQGDLSALLILPQNFLDTYQPVLVLPDPDARGPALAPLAKQLRRRALAPYFDAEKAELVLNPLRDLKREYLNEPEAAPEEDDDWRRDLKRMAMPLLFMILALIAMLTATDRLIRGLMEEKQNRLIEILLSSASADQLLVGKVLGLGGVGLVQLAVWTVLGLAPATFAFQAFDFGFGDFFVLTGYFVLGYFLLAVCTLGVGSVGSTHQEASQWSMVITLTAVVPMFLTTALIDTPDSQLAKGLTLFPFTAPIAGVSRHASGALPWHELALSWAILLISGLIAVKVCAKIFRVGILMVGQSPTPRSVWRALRMAR